jgi:DNA adenine methylase
MTKLQPFPWYGGKVRHVQKIGPLLPDTKKFVSVFGGSASVLLNRDPSGLEVLNDLNEDVMAFFKALRDSPDELIRWLEYTPYHELAFEKSKEMLESGDLGEVDRAGHFFVRTVMSYNGWDSDTFAYSTSSIRRDRSQHTSRYEHKLDQLDEIADRLHRVQFLSRDFREVIEKFDKSDTLIYCDPPYPPDTRSDTDNYRFEMDRSDHRDLLSLILDHPEKVAVSSYESDLYNVKLLPQGWNLVRFDSQGLGATNSGNKKREVLYTNFPVSTDEYQVLDSLNDVGPKN